MNPAGRLLTIGYGNAVPADFFAALADQQVDLALDARLVPYGWHENYRGARFLAALVSEGRVSRARWSERLGNAAKRDGGEMRLADPGAIADLLTVLHRGWRVLVICGCAEVEHCHRRLIADLAQAADPDLIVEHLPTPPRPPRTASTSAAGSVETQR
jgi:hypothetical protein